VTEVEVKERKDRVDDALNATRAAVQEGIVPGGGGTALLRANPRRSRPVLRQLRPGSRHRHRAPRPRGSAAPDRRERRCEGSIVVGKIREKTDTFGFNAQTGEYGDMIAIGIMTRPRWCAWRFRTQLRSPAC
jgi:chaperonin GroEL